MLPMFFKIKSLYAIVLMPFFNIFYKYLKGMTVYFIDDIVDSKIIESRRTNTLFFDVEINHFYLTQSKSNKELFNFIALTITCAQNIHKTALMITH